VVLGCKVGSSRLFPASPDRDLVRFLRRSGGFSSRFEHCKQPKRIALLRGEET
jgi:hypothetical protein